MSNQTSFKNTLRFNNVKLPDNVYHKLLSITKPRLDKIAGALPIHLGMIILFKENVSVNIHRALNFLHMVDTCNIHVNINTEFEQPDDLGYLLYETVFENTKEHFDFRFIFEDSTLTKATLIYVDATGKETEYEAEIRPLHKTSNIVGYSDVGECNPSFFTPESRLTEKETT